MKFILEKCPRCGYETPVEPLVKKEGVLEVVVCAQCDFVFIQGPPDTERAGLMPMEDKRKERNSRVREKIRKWWEALTR